MKVASSLVSGLHPTPELAAEAVRNALQGAGLQRADSVLLFLTRDYVRHAPPAIVAAARAAGTLQVSGCTAFGLLTEQGWLLDQPGAAALVFAHPAPPAAADDTQPLLSFTGQHTLPYAWQAMPERAGLLDTEAVSWSHGRVAEQPGAEIRLAGVHTRLCLAPGLRRLNLPLTVNAATEPVQMLLHNLPLHVGPPVRRLGQHGAHDARRPASPGVDQCRCQLAPVLDRPELQVVGTQQRGQDQPSRPRVVDTLGTEHPDLAEARASDRSLRNVILSLQALP